MNFKELQKLNSAPTNLLCQSLFIIRAKVLWEKPTRQNEATILYAYIYYYLYAWR